MKPTCAIASAMASAMAVFLQARKGKAIRQVPVLGERYGVGTASCPMKGFQARLRQLGKERSVVVDSEKVDAQVRRHPVASDLAVVDLSSRPSTSKIYATDAH